MKLTEQERQVLKHIRNWMVHTGEVPSYRKLMNLLGYKSTRSISLILESLLDKGLLKKSEGQFEISDEFPEDEVNFKTIDVPLVGNIACGRPILAQEHIEEIIPITISLARPPHTYYILRAKGNSMNQKNIHDGTLVLVRKQETARDGDIVVAIINDECTLKEFKRKDNYILLIPHSDNGTHKPIILTEDFRVQGMVVAILPNLQ